MHALLLALLLHGPIDSAVQLVMRNHHIAGISLGIARGGRLLYTQGYGERDVLRHLPAQPQTVYRIGSLTKMFTARAMETLAQRGKLGLDRPAARYLPNLPWDANITIADLLAQRSGIPSYTDDAMLNPYAWYAPVQLVDAVAHQPLQFAPGSQFFYSNTNYVLLGMIAQHVTRMPFEDFLNTRVIAPLRLQRTRYGDQPGEALGYEWNGDTLVRSVPSSPAYAFSAAAMSSNVYDLLHFMRTMREPYYGLLQSEQFGSTVWYASGNVNGYSAFAFIVPQSGDEAVILSNADKVDLAPLALDVLSVLQPQASGGFGPPQNEDPRITARVRQRAIALFAPLGVMLVEFQGEKHDVSTNVLYRVTLSNGSRVLLRAVVLPSGAIGVISVSPL
ncbi:MAG TPA: serine hydrolase domain-containing protein [Candidatus Baltobacteraceae bacterium]|nr:serine hydrolase domain-containing protein [Candidatus Baltobacteraceae bacterium]